MNYAWLWGQAPVFFLPEPGIWLATRYREAAAVLRDPQRFASDLPPIGIDLPYHDQLARLLTGALSSGVLDMLTPQVRQIADQLLDQVSEAGIMDLTEDLAAPLPLAVLAALLGVPPADGAQFGRWAGLFAANASGVQTRREGREYLRQAEAMQAYCRSLIAQRQAEPQNDLLSRLLSQEGGLTEADLLWCVALLLEEGPAMVTGLLGNAIWTLLDHPEALAELRAEPALVGQALDEVLRFRPPTPMLFRVAAEPVELGGQRIEQGARVMALLGAANRDPERFVVPDWFDIHRAPAPLVAFGQGVPFGPAALLIRLTVTAALEAMLDRLHDLRRLGDGELELMEGMLLHGPRSLRLAFRPASRVEARSGEKKPPGE